jgi:hypothetical protein
LLALVPLLVVPVLHRRARAEGVRAEITATYARWEKARTSHDRATFEELLAPEFEVVIGAQRLSRAQFIAEIAEPRAGARLVRFDSDVLTLTQERETWVAVIVEKLEFELAASERVYSLWVTKDRFRELDGVWRFVSSEAVGFENWSGGALPPFDDWEE